MQDLKYYVLWTNSSVLLKEYFDRYFEKLKNDLKNILEIELYNKLLNISDFRDFILNPDISSLINSIILDEDAISIDKLNIEINIFLEEWIDSTKLTLNKWSFIWNTSIRLTDIDNNPYNKQEAHPDHKSYWAISWNWWVKSEKDWLSIYEKTFSLLEKVDSWIYDELNQIIKKIVPLWTSNWVHNSASYKECVWHLYMWYTIDTDKPEINNLEAIIHESSHNKLNLIMHFDPVVLNDNEEKYYSAIRPDARHIKWVFLGYHAFAPTMYIVMKAYRDGFLWDDKSWLEKIVLYHIKTKFLQKVIKKYAKLTSIWKEISYEIDYVIKLMDEIIKQLNPDKKIIENAKKRQIQHFMEVNKNYPYLEY